MNELLKKIAEAEKISNLLEISAAEREKSLKLVGQFAGDYIDRLPEALSFIDKEADPEELKIKPETTHSLEEILEVFEKEVAEKGLRAASGGHVGYIPGGGIYGGALGDFLAAISNEYAGISYASPGAVAIENEVIRWLKSIFDFPSSAVGNLTSGGSIANMIALTAARDKYRIKNEKVPKSVIYLSKQVHHSLTKSLKIIGLEDVQLRYIELDEDFRMKPDHLDFSVKKDLEAGLFPFLIIASAGTTDVGAIDPLDEIAAIANRHGLWFHVDAAYGGFFILSSKKDLFKGIEKVDSLVVDPHKGMFLPYGLGAVLVKDAKAVLHSHQTTGNYMQDAFTEDLVLNPANLSPELTRHFRGLRLWLPLQLHGIKPFIACLEEKILLTEYFRRRLVAIGFEVGPKPDLTVSYFWYPFKENQNEKNKKLMQYIHEDGTVFLSSTVLNDRFVIRMAILSFRTKLETIDKALKMIERCLKRLMEEE